MPLHRASLALERLNTGHGASFKAGLLYTGSNNQLHRPPFVVIDASVTQSLKPFDLTLSVANLTNVYADQFTLTAQGVPYPGKNGAISTDAYSLPARTLTLTFSKHL
jgi:TonB dependent receptor